MRFVQQDVEFFNNMTYEEMLETIELSARNCYQSTPAFAQDKNIRKKEQETFIKRLIDLGHVSVLEHCSIHMRITTDRAVLAQLTRHRTGHFSVESQRYCNYCKDKFGKAITFIEQPNMSETMIQALNDAENYYFKLIDEGYSPENARAVLPNATKVTVITTFDLRNLRHFLNLRMNKEAQQQIREIANMIYNKMLKEYPVFVTGLNNKIKK